MNKSKDFLEFVKNNPPPCLPDDILYWFDEETGEIRQDSHPIGTLVLDENWEWKIIDDDTGEIVTPNETQYFCITPEDAKKFRDKITSVVYVVFRPDVKGLVTMEEEKYSFFKSDTLTDIKSMSINEDYFAAILKKDAEIEPGMVIRLKHNSYLVCEGGNVEDCVMKITDKETKRILEDVFEKDQ